MSTYNRENYIKEAVDSILNQTFTDFEFIIFDNASTDSTQEILEEYARRDSRIVYIRNSENKGYVYNLKCGVDMARGEYIARIDDDDISLPKRFARQVEYLDNNPDITVLGTFIQMFGNDFDETWVEESDPDILSVLMNFINPICHPSVMIRKSFLKEHNLNYKPEYTYADEYELWSEILEKGGKLKNLPEVLTRYRLHEARESFKDSKKQDIVANKVKYKMLLRFFDTVEDCDRVLNTLTLYPFSANNRKVLYDVFETIKSKNKGYLSEKAIKLFENKYIGIPSTLDIFFASGLSLIHI